MSSTINSINISSGDRSIRYLTQTASCKYGLEVALNSIKSRGRRDYGARYYNSLLFN